MSRPLIIRNDAEKEAHAFHVAVFKNWGNKCYRCKAHATDAAHIIPRSKLGPHRYASPVTNGRPLCRTCHDSQEKGEWDFPKVIRNRAIRALNKVLKIRLEEL